MGIEELILDGVGGQECRAVITKRDRGRASGCGRTYVRFESTRGYGYPSLELDEMKLLLAKMKAVDK